MCRSNPDEWETTPSERDLRTAISLIDPMMSAIAIFRSCPMASINAIFDSLKDGPAAALPVLRKLDHSDEGKSFWDDLAV